MNDGYVLIGRNFRRRALVIHRAENFDYGLLGARLQVMVPILPGWSAERGTNSTCICQWLRPRSFCHDHAWQSAWPCLTPQYLSTRLLEKAKVPRTYEPSLTDDLDLAAFVPPGLGHYVQCLADIFRLRRHGAERRRSPDLRMDPLGWSLYVYAFPPPASGFALARGFGRCSRTSAPVGVASLRDMSLDLRYQRQRLVYRPLEALKVAVEEFSVAAKLAYATYVTRLLAITAVRMTVMR